MLDDQDYELSQRFVPTLLDLGFIQEEKYATNINGWHIDGSFYIVTGVGKEKCQEWINKQN